MTTNDNTRSNVTPIDKDAEQRLAAGTSALVDPAKNAHLEGAEEMAARETAMATRADELAETLGLDHHRMHSFLNAARQYHAIAITTADRKAGTPPVTWPFTDDEWIEPKSRQDALELAGACAILEQRIWSRDGGGPQDTVQEIMAMVITSMDELAKAAQEQGVDNAK